MHNEQGIEKHAITQHEKERLLVGACELGLLESAWEHFVNKPKYQYLFVIDAPTISSVYALPPHNIAYFGIAGLLDAPEAPADLKGKPTSARQAHYKEEAKKYPLTLGLTEILARYLFDRRWSNGEPKLMMSSQTNRVGEIMDAVGRFSSHEFTQTYGRAGEGNPLQDLQKKYLSDPSKNAERFIDDVTQQLEKYLPAIYGAYTNTRQLLRYAEALPFPDRTEEEQETVFAHSYAAINTLLEQAGKEAPPADEEANSTLAELTALWGKVIPLSGASQKSAEDDEEEGTEHENARTLAEIEYLNQQFRTHNMPQRLVFVTTTARLFDAALLRHNAFHHRTKPNVKFGSSSNYNKCLYLSHLLSGDNPELELTPMLDPRALMTSADFVNFANRESKVSEHDNAREISAWLPAFFSNYHNLFGELDAKLIFDTYQHYQNVQRRDRHPRIINVDSFPTQHYSELKASWEKYIRIVSAAEGIDRIMQREMFHDIRARLLGDISLQALMGQRLDDAMSKWLSIVGGNALQATLHATTGKKTSAANTTSKFRVVPPLILPSFSSERVSLFKLMQHLNLHGSDFKISQFSWLTNPKPADFEIEESDQIKAAHKTRYIQMLGQAVLFASLNNWDAAYRLATQAYVLAEQFLKEDSDRDKPTYVSGREAAYFASVAARRLRTSWAKIDRPMSEGLGWIAKYRKAINEETYVRKFPLRREMLLLRGELEQIAWDTFISLYRMYRFSEQEMPFLIMSDAEQDAFRSQCLHIKGHLLSDQLIPARNEGQFDTMSARQAYRVTHTYLLRQVGSIGLHVELFFSPDEQSLNQTRIKEFVQLIESTICQDCTIEHEDCLPLSILERLLLQAGRKVTGMPSPATAVSTSQNKESLGFGLWRYERLSRLASEKSQ